MKKEKNFIEVEVIKEDKNSDFSQKNDFSKKMEENIKNFKRGLYWKIFLAFFPQILTLFLLLVLIFALIFLIFANPFDYIIVGVLIYFIIKNFIKFFKNIKK